MSRENVGVADLTELLHDAVLERGEWDAERNRLSLRFLCLRRGVDGADLADRAVDLVLSGVVAIAISYDPPWPEDRPSAFRVPDGCVIHLLSPWPLAARTIEVTADSDDACDDIDLATKTDWVKGDLRSAAGAPHRLVLRDDCGIPRVPRWITIAFDQVTPLSSGKALPWQAWGDQYEAWWRGWSQHWAGDRDAAAGPVLEDTFIPATSNGAARATDRIAEPVIDLEANDVPAELLAAVVAWFHAQHASDDETAQLAYARSITSWWLEGRRANVVVAGVEYYPPDEDEPAESIVTTYSFALRRLGAGWEVRMWTSRAADGPIPAWAARWSTGRVALRS